MIEYTSPWALAHGDGQKRPEEIDWQERQSRALIPFEVHNGRPVCPDRLSLVLSDVVHFGRSDMRFWGENPMADALVTVTFRGVRYVLLIERGDGGGWAMPGGAIEPGEIPLQAALRELREETGLITGAFRHFPNIGPWVRDAPRWVPDPRGSMEAWAVTVVARCDLGEVDALPEVRGGDDARQAEWWPIERIGWPGCRVQVFPAHREILARLV